MDLKDDPRYRRITARMLLGHTTGFPNWRAFEDDHRLHIHFEPGTRFAYSGEGINLLQLVVETITKKDLEELMQERVFRPLGMTRTSMVWKSAFGATTPPVMTSTGDRWVRRNGNMPTRRDRCRQRLTTLLDSSRQ